MHKILGISVAWKKMARPKAIGGLGFRDIQHFNDALLGKIAWRIVRNPDSLLAKILTSKYCSDSTFLDCKAPSVASHGWRGILIGRDLIRRKAIFSVGNGRKIRVMQDKWIPKAQHHKPFGPCTEVNAQLLVSDLISSHNRDWDRTKIDELLPEHREKIFSIKLSKEGSDDRLFWTPSRNGEYTTKSGYFELADDEQGVDSVPLNSFSWNSSVWNLRCSPKVQLFIWKLFQNAIPSGATLVSRGLNVSQICNHCGQEETTNHLLFHCSFARDVWKLVGWKAEISIPIENDLGANVLYLLKQELLPPYGLAFGLFTPWLLWGLWKRRNQKVFQNRAFSAQETFVKAVVDARDWELAQEHKLKTTECTGTSRAASCTVTPPADTDIVYTDASWSEDQKTAALGLVFTNSCTNRSFHFSEIEEFVYSPLVGEALAIRAAIMKAISLSLHRLHLYSDSKSCVELIQRNENHPELYDILQDIRSLSLSFVSFSVSFVPRSQNVDADFVARSSLSDFLFSKELESVPNVV